MTLAYKQSKMYPMKKLSKIKAGIFLGTALITNPMLNTSCLLQPNATTIQTHKEPTIKAEDYELLQATIGDKDGFTYFKVDDTLIFDNCQSEEYLNNKFIKYASNSIIQINDSITDENTKNYFNKCYRVISKVTPHKNIDGVLTTVDNSSTYIFTDLIKSLPNPKDQIKFFAYYKIIANEIYNQSFAYPGWVISINYHENKKEAIKYLVDCGIDKQTINSDIENNCVKIVTEYQQLLAEATTNLNQDKNMQLTTEQIKQLNSILFSMKCLENIHDSLISHTVCGNRSTLQLELTLKTIANKAKATEAETVR